MPQVVGHVAWLVQPSTSIGCEAASVQPRKDMGGFRREVRIPEDFDNQTAGAKVHGQVWAKEDSDLTWWHLAPPPSGSLHAGFGSGQEWASLDPEKTEVGDKRELAKSAAYPRAFGLAVAALMGPREPPCHEQVADFAYSGWGDDLNALGDLLHGPKSIWWRRL